MLPLSLKSHARSLTSVEACIIQGLKDSLGTPFINLGILEKLSLDLEHHTSMI